MGLKIQSLMKFRYELELSVLRIFETYPTPFRDYLRGKKIESVPK
ncbi:hypothetical protein HDC90_005244 [Pedobacter sp. AK013]|nr:hypothetical protein [Pedobacter sp. AK013]